MTQAFNLSQLANNLNTSGQLDATDGLVNAVPVTNGGTGASTASAARTNLGVAIGTDVPSPTGTGASGTWPIAISGNAATATNAATVTNGVYTTGNQTIGGTKTFTNGITFNDATVQTTAATSVPSSISAIGSILMVVNTSTSNLLPGSTIAGSSLYYPITISSTNGYIYTANDTWYRAGGYNAFALLPITHKNNLGNIGYTPPGGHTALSGTWRVLTIGAARASGYDAYENVTTSLSYCIFAQRIA